MLAFYLPLEYVLGMLFWLCLMGAGLVFGLKQRRRWIKIPGRLRWIHAGLSLWMLLACLTGCELFFALFVDGSDSFNMTNVCKRWFARHVEAQRNAQGFRDAREFSKTIEPGQKRICFVGDSFTIGHGISRMSDRFSDRIGSELDQKYPGKYLVANLGEAGWDASLIEGLVRATLMMEFEVNTIVYVYTLNDIEGYDPRTAETINKLQRQQPRSWLVTKTYFFNWMYFRFVQYAGSDGGNYFPQLKEAYVSAPWEGLRTKLDQLREECRNHGVDLRMVIFPDVRPPGPVYEFAEAHRILVDYCRNAGIRVLDLQPVLAAHAHENLVVSRYDAHPNERANQIAADAIREQLLDDYFADKPVGAPKQGL